MYSKSLVGKGLNEELGRVVRRILKLESFLLDGKDNKYDRNGRETKTIGLDLSV